MQSRRDQVQAQSYVLGRLNSALVSGEPDGLENPSRRTITGGISGILVAAIVVVGFAAYGFFRPGGASSWRKPGVLIVEKETGTRYLYAQDRLWPVLNYASVRMEMGADPKVVSVSRRSLGDVPHGQPVGIVGAPDALPSAAGLVGLSWTVCPRGATVTVGIRPSGTAPIGTDRAMAVRSGGQLFLLIGGQRRRVPDPKVARVLGFDRDPVEVRSSWLDLVPAGSDIIAFRPRGSGGPGPDLAGQPSVIGRLYVARGANSPDRYYVMRDDGLSPLTATGYTIMAVGDGVGEPVEIGPGAVAQTPLSEVNPFYSDLPADPPQAVQDSHVWCARWLPGGGFDLVGAEPAPEPAAIVRDAPGVVRTTRTASAVSVTAGAGGLVRVARGGSAPGGGYLLVTDAGVKYPLAGPEVAQALGYPPGTAAPMPPELLDVLPTGPVLDPSRVFR